jgi:hypothetical protein
MFPCLTVGNSAPFLRHLTKSELEQIKQIILNTVKTDSIYLIHQDEEPPWTHDLKLLCKMCADLDETFDAISQSCINLTPYGVPRYPFEIEIFDADMQKTITDAEQVRNYFIK